MAEWDRRSVIVSSLAMLAGCGGGGSQAPQGGNLSLAKVGVTPSPAPTPDPSPTNGAVLDFDIVIYGSNLGGLGALMRAAGRRGKRVCVIEPYTKVGGIHAAGLTHLDYAQTGLCGGDVRTGYLNLLASLSGNPDAKWDFEPKIALRAAQNLLAQYSALTMINTPLETTQVVVETTAQGRRVKGVQTPSGLITAKAFIDASYEGDLMAGALGPSGYTYGRESAAEYGETSAGYLAGRLAPGSISLGKGGAAGYPYLDDPNLTRGDADNRYQAYNFRLPLTRSAANRIPFNKPPEYDVKLYDTQLRVLATLGYTKFARDKTAQSLGFQANLPNSKIAWNALDMINGNVGYADGNWATRRQIVNAHNAWQQGLMWCIANDPVATTTYGLGALQQDAKDCGLCADEFQDGPFGPGWPFWLYVRESRRLKGMYKMTERDILIQASGGNPTKATSIGRWQYAWDFHLVQGFFTKKNSKQVYVEGDSSNAGVLTAIYDIPAECMFPPQSSCINLIVSTCASFSHVAWAPHRMEVAHGLCGEAAGEIAAWACDTGLPVQSYDYTVIRQRLLQFGTVLA